MGRDVIRNVHFYEASRPTEPPGGLYLNPSVTRRKFLRMLELIFHVNGPYSVWFRGADNPLAPTDDPLEPGHYYIVCNIPGGMIWVIDERCIARSFHMARFREQVRSRDGKCVITGVINPVADRNDWKSFEAAHIFPLSHEELSVWLNYSQYVTHWSEGTDAVISSCQNGLLMRDDNMDGIDGRFLDPVCRHPGDERRVIDEFLRWHFRQTSDFPDGSDMVSEIINGPRAADRMEAELFSRLNRLPPVP
ncbi:hypothetical protein POJ06DRAFT_293922 [Lipomyces tetrasporus]|uniref:HNH nuclease domain-containing protein n=1 Tax=Lipomyces tetrasporus TaxID=54092 RepID=A0AAD7QYZ7_9ASCO|nr:uncharacterized protein POJ06DRAFT_293922 [Lipomyces tetrasporus]KAJ8102407.1 hypothetical protein POJ06DRAFT_293922 [Lipomyces tetrasporus]